MSSNEQEVIGMLLAQTTQSTSSEGQLTQNATKVTAQVGFDQPEGCIGPNLSPGELICLSKYLDTSTNRLLGFYMQKNGKHFSKMLNRDTGQLYSECLGINRPGPGMCEGVVGLGEMLHTSYRKDCSRVKRYC